MGGLRAYFDPEYLKMPAIPHVIPPALLAWFNSPEGKWFRKEIDEDIRREDARGIRQRPYPPRPPGGRHRAIVRP